VKLLLLACALGGGWAGAAASRQAFFDWGLPSWLPRPYVPLDNPMTAQKVTLGRYLFYDTRVSLNGKESCATCHRQALAFTDGRKVSVGTTGQLHPRNAMSLVNVAYASVLTWSDPKLTRLEDQMLVPMYGAHPVELGLKLGDRFLLEHDPTYKPLFSAAFPGASDPYSMGNVVKALACFERTIISKNTPYDRYHYGGDDHAVSEAAKRGEELFFSEPCKCFQCHSGFNFSDATRSARSHDGDLPFHNTGLYNVVGPFSYPAPNRGTFEHTGLTTDMGAFKTPTLRNVAVTGPNMHDGSIATLGEVLDHYSSGGRTIATGPNAGVGSKNPNKDPRIAGFTLTAQGKSDMIAFLETLTDEDLLHDPKLSDPWLNHGK